MSDELDALFREAVSAIDAGDREVLEALLVAHPELVAERLAEPGPWLREQVGAALDGFFERPWLLWFVAEDPVRNGRLPGNVAALAQAIVDAALREVVASLQEQLDSTLRLVSWSWIARARAMSWTSFMRNENTRGLRRGAPTMPDRQLVPSKVPVFPRT